VRGLSAVAILVALIMGGAYWYDRHSSQDGLTDDQARVAELIHLMDQAEWYDHHYAVTHDPDDLRQLNEVTAQSCVIANTLEDAIIPAQVKSYLIYYTDCWRGDTWTPAAAS
jgi:hypothetical protein